MHSNVNALYQRLCAFCAFLWLDLETGSIGVEAVEISEDAERKCFGFEISARDFLKFFDSRVADLFDHVVRRDATAVNDLLSRERAGARAGRFESEEDRRDGLVLRDAQLFFSHAVLYDFA